MRTIITFLLSILAIVSNAKTTYQKLCEVNNVWKEQDVSAIGFPEYANFSEQQWIQLHLSLVERTLRSRNTDQLTPRQQYNRFKVLDHLHRYWQMGNFPQNEEYSYRTPIFIDKYDNFCAVGYLVKATGYEHVARKISALTNLAYVRDMHYEDLCTWGNEYGFTVDELAWIQPGYPGPTYSLSVGSGTAGTVNELYVDPSSENLYVGGSFTNTSTSVTCNNIARITSANGLEWHNMGAGVNGNVEAIAQFVNDVFVAGTFSIAGNTSVNNVAKWNGADWQSAGCIQGSIRDMIVYNGNLYACGDFSLCSSSISVNFAVWDGLSWTPIIGTYGAINTMEVYNGEIVLGGSLIYQSLQVSAIRWAAGIGFRPFTNYINNEVKDFEVNPIGILYASCKQTAQNDSNMVYVLSNNTWRSVYRDNSFAGASFNSMCSMHSKMIIGGSFNVSASIQSALNNGFVLQYSIDSTLRIQGSYPWTLTHDSTINKIVYFNGHVIVGGEFTGAISRLIYYAHVAAGADMLLNNCNGSDGNVMKYIWNGFAPYKIEWSTGETNDTLYNKPPGTYTVIVTDSIGDRDTASIVVGPVNFGQIKLDTANHILFIEGMNQTFFSEYQWYNCTTRDYIRFGFSSAYKPEVTGSYACIVTLNGCTEWSDSIYVEVPTTSVSSQYTSQVSLYPNPVTEVLNIDFGRMEEKLTARITDITGRVHINVNEQNQSALSIDMSSLSTGMYTTMVTHADGSTSIHKIVKQ